MSGDGSQTMRELRIQMDNIPMGENLDISQQMRSDPSRSNFNSEMKEGKQFTLRSTENMNQTLSQRSKMSTLDGTKHVSKSKKKGDNQQPAPWCSNVKKDTKNKLYSKMKNKLEDVSVVLGFNTARGDPDEQVSLDGSKYKKSKSKQLTLEEPERLDKAVTKILNSRNSHVQPKNSRNLQKSARGARTAECRKSVDLAKLSP